VHVVSRLHTRRTSTHEKYDVHNSYIVVDNVITFRSVKLAETLVTSFS